MTRLAPPITNTRRLLRRLIEAPDLAERVQGLPPHTFRALVRSLGLADAGEIVALASSQQLLTAFDEDLFVSDAAGERERFDPVRFATWLEVLLEAGEDLASARMAELGEDFLAHAISSLALVLDHEALLLRLGEAGDDADAVDKALESSFVEELDGYLVVSKGADGWDALWSLIVALDRNHRSFLVRVLDLAVAAGSDTLDDLDELASVLCAAESLAEDVEAAREERRAKHGYVEPRAARAFLTLARGSAPGEPTANERDPITRAYFRNLEPSPAPLATGAIAHGPAWLGGIGSDFAKPASALPAPDEGSGAGSELPMAAALRLLAEREAGAFAQRMDELAYLANVILAGAQDQGRRFTPAEASVAALASVALGAELEANGSGPLGRPATSGELADVLTRCPADFLFRVASGRLASHATSFARLGLVRSRDELCSALRELMPHRARASSKARGRCSRQGRRQPER